MIKIQRNVFILTSCFAMLLVLSGCGDGFFCKKNASSKSQQKVVLPKEPSCADNQMLSFNEDVEAFILADDIDETPFYDTEDELSEFAFEEEFPLDWDELEESVQVTFKEMHYGYDKNLLENEQREALEENIDKLVKPVQQDGKTIVIKTNRCVCGAESYNKTLADQAGHYLAEEIRFGLMKRGVDEDIISIKVVGMGSEEACLNEDTAFTLAQRKQNGDLAHAVDRWARLSVQTI